MKKIYRFIYVTVSILCMLNLSSCSGEKTNTKAEIEKIQVDKLSESPVELNITPKLNFDEAIIDIPDVNEMYSLKLTRPILNMQELTDEFTASTEKFLDRKIDKSMLKYRYSNGKDEPTYLGISDSPEFKLNFNMLSYTDEETYDETFFCRMECTGSQINRQYIVKIFILESLIYCGSMIKTRKNKVKILNLWRML